MRARAASTPALAAADSSAAEVLSTSAGVGWPGLEADADAAAVGACSRATDAVVAAAAAAPDAVINVVFTATAEELLDTRLSAATPDLAAAGVEVFAATGLDFTAAEATADLGAAGEAAVAEGCSKGALATAAGVDTAEPGAFVAGVLTAAFGVPFTACMADDSCFTAVLTESAPVVAAAGFAGVTCTLPSMPCATACAEDAADAAEASEVLTELESCPPCAIADTVPPLPLVCTALPCCCFNTCSGDAPPCNELPAGLPATSDIAPPSFICTIACVLGAELYRWPTSLKSPGDHAAVPPTGLTAVGGDSGAP